MEQTNYSNLLPTEPPEGMIDWLAGLGTFDLGYIVYKSDWVYDPLTEMKKKVVHCVCSGCEREFNASYMHVSVCSRSYPPAPFGFLNPETSEEVISGKTTVCPYCDTEAEAVHISNIRGTRAVNDVYPMTIDRIGDRIALIGWRIVRVLHKDGRTTFETYPYEAYVAEDKKIVRLTGYISGIYRSRTFTGEWHQCSRFNDTWGKVSVSMIYNWDPNILIGTSLENSKLDKYLKCDKEVYPVTYCNLFLKHKNAENIIMQGMGKLINEKLQGLGSYYKTGLYSIKQITGINWKESKPHKMLGLTKDEFKTAKRKKWTDTDITFYRSVSESGITPDDVADCKRYGYYAVQKFIENHPAENVMKVIRYLDKQKRKYPKQTEPDLQFITDYWNMCVQLGEDIFDNDVCYPQNLVRAHDMAAGRVKYKENKELITKFIDRNKHLSQFNYTANGLFIRPAATEAELIAEGKVLHHCVGGYAKRHANGKTAIFFIRHVSEPDTSYFTLELDESNLTVKQNRGRYNCAKTDEVIKFEAEWLDYIRNLPKEDNDDGKQCIRNKTAAA